MTDQRADLREYPPRPAIVLLAALSIAALAAVVGLVRLPVTRDLVVVSADADRVQVGGLGIPATVHGQRIVLTTSHGDLAGVESDRVRLPDGQAEAVEIRLDRSTSVELGQYEDVQVDFGSQRLISVLRSSW